MWLPLCHVAVLCMISIKRFSYLCLLSLLALLRGFRLRDTCSIIFSAIVWACYAAFDCNTWSAASLLHVTSALMKLWSLCVPKLVFECQINMCG